MTYNPVPTYWQCSYKNWVYTPSTVMLELHYCSFYARYNSIKYCELSNNSVINTSALCIYEILLPSSLWVAYEFSLHHSAGRRPNFCNYTTAAFMLDIIQSNIMKCLITGLSMHLHPAFTKFCCRLHYESHTSWSLHHSAGHSPNICNCTTATGVTQLWCCVSIHIVNCLITQLSMQHLHPAFMKFCWLFTGVTSHTSV
jgi:hypothetical protein